MHCWGILDGSLSPMWPVGKTTQQLVRQSVDRHPLKMCVLLQLHCLNIILWKLQVRWQHFVVYLCIWQFWSCGLLSFQEPVKRDMLHNWFTLHSFSKGYSKQTVLPYWQIVSLIVEYQTLPQDSRIIQSVSVYNHWQLHGVQVVLVYGDYTVIEREALLWFYCRNTSVICTGNILKFLYRMVSCCCSVLIITSLLIAWWLSRI